MKKISIVVILLTILVIPLASAKQTTNDAGVTPDSFLWGLDKAIEQLNLLLTFDKGEKARKGIEIASERLLEVKAMVEENKLEAAEKAKEEHGKALVKVKQRIKEIKKETSTEEIEEVVEIEKELEELDEDVEQTFKELKVKIEVKSEVTQQQRDLIDSIFKSLGKQAGEVKIEIKNKKDKIKIEIKAETGKSEKEIEEDVEDIEEEKGLAGIKKEKALEEIEDAKEELAEFEEELQEHKAEGHVADEAPITSLIDNAKKRLSNAEEAFAKNDSGEAFGQANAAKQLIENAERILEKLVEKFEEEDTCEEISGETFRSVKQYETGLGPDGTVLGYWNVGFKNGQFSWSYSDIVEEGSYVCDGKSITGTSTSGSKLTGEYDIKEDTLIWEGIKYADADEDSEDEKDKEGKICKIGGCSGELCGGALFIDDIASICIYKPEYECYKLYGECKKQPDGRCGWSQTGGLVKCIDEKKEKQSEDKQSCEEQGGVWGPLGLLGTEMCNLPTSDAGKECTDPKQCESVCVTENSVQIGEETKGKCYGWTKTIGTCLNYVENGKSIGTLCAD